MFRYRMRQFTATACGLMLSLFLVLATGPRMASAQTNHWTSLGPEGGTISRLVVDPQNPTTVYAANYEGGIFTTTDGAKSWRAANSGLTTTVIVGLVIDSHSQSDDLSPNAVYALTAVGAVFKSTDRGMTWNEIGSVPARASSLAIDPATPDTLYAGNCGGGLFKSTDGGATWAATGFPASSTDCISVLVIDPLASTTLYAAGGRGLFKSTDGGESWSALGTAGCLAIDPQDSNIAYACQNGIFKTTDGGITWTNAGLARRTVRSLTVDPQNSGTVYAVADSRVFKSTDGGTNWEQVTSGLPLSVATVAIDPRNPSILYAGADDLSQLGNGTVIDGVPANGVFKSTDSGTSWNAVNSGLQATVVSSLAIDPQNRDTIFAATRDGAGPLWKSTDRGTSWKAVKAAAGGVVIDPQNPASVYAWSYYLGLEKSGDGGTRWQPVSGPGAIWKLAIDPQNTGTLYGSTGDVSCLEGVCGTGGVFKSADGGVSWSKSGLQDFWVRDVVVDPQNPNTIYAGGFLPPFVGSASFAWGSMGVYKSTDGGQSWDVVNPMLPGYPCLAIDPREPGAVYAYGCGGLRGGWIFKSTDGGKSWSESNSGLPATFVLTMAIDPQNPTTLYAGTADAGVFQSKDGGASWTAVNAALTSLSIATLAIDPRDTNTVYAGTNGGGVFAITFVSHE